MEMLFMHFYAKQLCWLNWVCLYGECVTSSHVLLLVWTDTLTHTTYKTRTCQHSSWNSIDFSKWLDNVNGVLYGKRPLYLLSSDDRRTISLCYYCTLTLHSSYFRCISWCIINTFTSPKLYFFLIHTEKKKSTPNIYNIRTFKLIKISLRGLFVLRQSSVKSS